MNVLVTGVNFQNKGAELMMLAVAARVSSWGGRLYMPMVNGAISQRRQRGVGHYAWRPVRDATWVGSAGLALSSFLGKGLRGQLNVANASDVDAVLDASGLLFSSQAQAAGARRREAMLSPLRSRGKPVVFLPQAFGPFTNAGQAQAVRRMLEYARLVFARDRVSAEHLQRLGVWSDRMRQAPDFTNLLGADVEGERRRVLDRVLIVPNVRMLRDAGPAAARAYPDFLSKAILCLKRIGLDAAWLVHSQTGDADVVHQVNRILAQPLEVLVEADALRIKALIGASAGIVASRFHAVVSALSQSRPALVAGWSHKYSELLSDYGVPRWEISASASRSEIADSVERAFVQSDLSALARQAEAEKARAEEMWQRVERELGVQR